MCYKAAALSIISMCSSSSSCRVVYCAPIIVTHAQQPSIGAIVGIQSTGACINGQRLATNQTNNNDDDTTVRFKATLRWCCCCFCCCCYFFYSQNNQLKYTEIKIEKVNTSKQHLFFL